jgi:hypothetical protein
MDQNPYRTPQAFPDSQAERKMNWLALAAGSALCFAIFVAIAHIARFVVTKTIDFVAKIIGSDGTSDFPIVMATIVALTLALPIIIPYVLKSNSPNKS